MPGMLKIQDIAVTGLEPVALDIAEGECIGITGDSGCGKTRLLRAIADMDEFEGDVRLGDISRQDMPAHEWRKQVCLLPAESQWWFDTVAPHFNDEPDALASLGFAPEVMQWQLSRCSSGEKQRLAILRALANRPRVLLLDEPTANLDAENSRRVEALLADYLEENKAVAIWVSHNRAQLERVASQHCYALSDGELELIESDSGTEHA